MDSRRIPAFLITGVSQTATATTTLGLQLDLPNPVVVSHDIDPDGATLHRTVSDLSGVLERDTIDLEHACVSCAIREDVIPTLARLADLGRWDAIIARFPAGAEALQVCRVAAYEPAQLGPIRISAVVTALESCRAVDDLTGPDLLCESDAHTFLGDERGVAEVATRLLEYADVVAVDGDLSSGCASLVRSLTAPHATIVSDWSQHDMSSLASGVHDHDMLEDWVDEVPMDDIPDTGEGVWRLRLRSDRPMHPSRMQDNLERLGSGRQRGRGCFWVPTRPRSLCVWDGAGGQLSIGAQGRWDHRRRRRTDIVMTGLLAHGDPRRELREAFDASLATPIEMQGLGGSWTASSDGLEPWLGQIEEVA